MMPTIFDSDKDRMEVLLPLFERSPHHHIARAACQGLIPCRAYADRADSPKAAILVIKRFGVGFVAGNADNADALLNALRNWHPEYDLFDPPPSWHPALAHWSLKSYGMIRYGTCFDNADDTLTKLQAMLRPPEGCHLRLYDRSLLEQALSMEWSQDQVGTFASIDDFLSKGFGFALVREGALLSGCSCFCRHPDGYEIQVDTHPDAKRKGYATCVSAAFILETLARGKIPYWDAANHASLKLAQKLGFRLTCGFVAWKLIATDDVNMENQTKADKGTDVENQDERYK